MDADSRVSLPPGWQLTITNEHTGNVCTLTIQEEVGRGGSCIVYRGIQKDFYLGDQSLEKNVILKEFYLKLPTSKWA